MKVSEVRKFQCRMAKRTYRHGKNWRQVFINCGGMCINCYKTEGLEFHEPFGENHNNWLKFQSRVLLCPSCHSEEHGNIFREEARYIRRSQLSEDIDIEIMMHGGYNQWIKDFNLEDTFASLILAKEV